MNFKNYSFKNKYWSSLEIFTILDIFVIAQYPLFNDILNNMPNSMYF